MPPLIITTKYQLKAWLDENRWFEVANIVDLSPRPLMPGEAPYKTPESVTFRLENCARGGMYAGDVMEFDSFLVNAGGVSTWSCIEAGYIADPGYAEENEIVVDEGSDRLKLVIDGHLTLECTEMRIGEPTRRTSIVRPSLSPQDCLIHVSESSLPTAFHWIDWFAVSGLEVVFRMYGDQARLPADVPSDYSGWFLQLRSLLAETNGGLMFFGVNDSSDWFKVKFNFWNSLGEREAPLWMTLAKVVATVFPTSHVSCGNCRLTGEQWLVALEQGQPYLDSVFGKD